MPTLLNRMFKLPNRLIAASTIDLQSALRVTSATNVDVFSPGFLNGCKPFRAAFSAIDIHDKDFGALHGKKNGCRQSGTVGVTLTASGASDDGDLSPQSPTAFFPRSG